MKKIFVSGLVAAVMLSGDGTLFADALFREGTPEIEKAAASPDAVIDYPHFTGLAKALSPAVVNIAVEGAVDKDGDGDAESPIPGLPFFKKDPAIPLNSLGSGFIVHEDGFVVTNNHVVRDAKRIVVRLLDDKNEYEAKIVGQDLMTDLALLKIESKDKLTVAYLGDSDKVEVGEWVLAIGNQFQLGQTVTAGIVSAKSRRVGGSPSRPYDQFIQTDAPINPGSSGGPLFNTQGQVIGINTAIFSPGRAPQMGGTGFNIGIGFAIPINLVKGVIGQLRDTGKVTRGLLGVLIQEIEPDLAKALNLPSTDGALVSEVKTGSPADKAGFKRRDVIVSFNGQHIKDHSELPLKVANTRIGSEATIEVLRDGKKLSLKATVGELKPEAPAQDAKEKPKADAVGLVVKALSEEQAQMLGVAIESGVMVESVEPGSAADKARLVRGDLIQELGGKQIRDPQGFAAEIGALKKDVPVPVLVRRKEGSFFLVIKGR